MDRAYQDIFVSRVIYCSSSYDHFTNVSWKRHGKRKGAHLDIGRGNLLTDYTDELKVPAYVWTEINRQVLAMLVEGKARYHEYDRDGNKRWEDYRYHDPEWADRMILRLQAE